MLLSILNIIYFFVLIIFTFFYITGTPLLVIIFLLSKYKRFDDIFRLINHSYGYFLIKIFRPFIKMEVSGTENIIISKSYIIVYNHFSELDVAFSTFVPLKNQIILVRNWVFNIMPYGFYMRMAGYINTDNKTFDNISEKAEQCFKRNISMQIYPEGHRSLNGSIRRFRKGAFLLSCKHDVPVLPICIFNANKFLTPCFPYFNPVNIQIKILKPVYPGNFNYNEKELRKHVKDLYIGEFEK